MLLWVGLLSNFLGNVTTQAAFTSTPFPEQERD